MYAIFDQLNLASSNWIHSPEIYNEIILDNPIYEGINRLFSTWNDFALANKVGGIHASSAVVTNI